VLAEGERPQPWLAYRRGRRKHWLPRSSPIASTTARPRGRKRAAIKSKKVATLGGQKVAIGITGAR